jgi:hypothetical protein
MQASKFKVFCFIVFLAGLLVMSGCGSNDGLDELGGKFTFDLTLSDGGQDGTSVVDVVQNPDCDGDPNTSDPELFTDTTGTLTITVAADSATGIEVEGYRVDYIPQISPDGLGGSFTPPSLNSITLGKTFYAPIGATTDSPSAFLIVGVGTKEEFLNETPSLGGFYTIHLTIYYRYDTDDRNDTPRSRTINRDVELNNYNNC